MASSDITLNYGDIVVKVAWAGSEGSIVAGDGLVIASRKEQLICLGFNFVGFLQELLLQKGLKSICDSGYMLEHRCNSQLLPRQGSGHRGRHPRHHCHLHHWKHLSLRARAHSKNCSFCEQIVIGRETPDVAKGSITGLIGPITYIPRVLSNVVNLGTSHSDTGKQTILPWLPLVREYNMVVDCARTQTSIDLVYSPPRIRACLFDMDGLLIDSEDLYTKVTNEILQKYGRPNLPWSIKAQLQGRPQPEVRLKLCIVMHWHTHQ